MADLATRIEFGDLFERLQFFLRDDLKEYTKERSDGQEQPFYYIREEFERLREFAPLVFETDWYKLPKAEQQKLARTLNELNITLRAIREFDRSDVTTGRRETLASEFMERFGAFFSVASEGIRFLRKERSNEEIQLLIEQTVARLAPGIIENEFNLSARFPVHEISELVKEAHGRQEAMDRAVTEAEELVGQIKQLAVEGGVNHHATVFVDAAKKARYQGWAWLAVQLALVALTVWFGWVNYDQGRHEYDLWVKGKGQQEERALPAHIANALSTFEAFINRASDEATKEAVLLRTTEAIFAPQVTGFIPGEPDSSQPGHVLEIVKSMVPGGKTGQGG